MRSLTWTALAVPCVLLLVAGCGDDERPPPIVFDAGPRIDSGSRPDAFVEMDAGDAGPLPDAFVAMDAGEVVCTFAGPEDVFRLDTDIRATERTISVAPSVSGFAVAWHAAPAGLENVTGVIIPSSGMPGSPVAITDDTAISRRPAILNMGTGFLVSWFDNSTSGFEIWSRELDSALAPAGAASRLTNNDLRDDEPALMRLGSGVLAAWVEDDMLMSRRIVHTRVLDASGSPTAPAESVTMPPTSPTSPVLAPISGGAALAWAERDLSGADVTLVKLDATGASTGATSTLSTESNAAGSVGLALGEGGGATVFDVLVGGSRAEVRFRNIDGSGDALGVERILTLPPERARSPDIDFLGGGFVAAYRAIGDVDLTEPTLRVAFLSSVGDVLEVLDIVGVSEGGGRVTVRVAPDGSAILVAWLDLGLTETTINAARIRCM